MKTVQTTEIIKWWKVGPVVIKYHWRSKENLFGRFGGGWNWKLGVSGGDTTVIVDCLVFSLRFSKAKAKEL